MIEEPCTGIPPRTDRCAQLDVIANSLPVIVTPLTQTRTTPRFVNGFRPRLIANPKSMYT